MGSKLVFICTNDMHCALLGDSTHLGLDGVAGLASRLRSEYGADAVCLVDGGDALGVGVAGCVSAGEVPLHLMGACGYAAYCPGNADVSFGARRLTELALSSPFPFVCCNMRDAETGDALFPAYALREVGGVPVGFVGVTTPLCHAGTEAADYAAPLGAVKMDCCQDADGKRLVEAVQGAVDAARASGAQVVVSLSHLGQGGEHGPFRSDSVVAATRGIDLVVDGHSHESCLQKLSDAAGRPVPVVQGGFELSQASVVVLDEHGRLEGVRHVGRADVELDDKMSQVILEAMRPYDEGLSRAVCELPVTLRARDADGSWLVRRVETNLGDLVADALCAAFGADAALVPSWIMRDDLRAGCVCMRDVCSMHPLGHRVCCVRATGLQIIEALRLGASRYPKGFRYWLQLSEGLDVRLGGAGGEIAGAELDGAPLDPEASYALAGLDFMVAGGGSGFAMLTGCEALSESVPLVDVVADYLRATSPDEIAARYGDVVGGAGRITASRA